MRTRTVEEMLARALYGAYQEGRYGERDYYPWDELVESGWPEVREDWLKRARDFLSHEAFINL